MKRIITYDELPKSRGESIYLRMETDPKLYVTLLSKGYKIINHIDDTKEDTIYVTGKRQDYDCIDFNDYKEKVELNIENRLKEDNIVKPNTYKFSFKDLVNHQYKLPFVLKNENQNGGREKFLINTEEDYENLINACSLLLDKDLLYWQSLMNDDIRYRVDYKKYLENNFTVQDYINTPSNYNTTVRLLTTSADDLLYASLKYNKTEEYSDNTTLLGYLLSKEYPLSTKSIVSNTLSGGENILLGENNYLKEEKKLLRLHDIGNDKFEDLINSSLHINKEFKKELGIICGFDYIYDKDKEKWFLLEYHSRPMVGDYSKRNNISYITKEDRLMAEGRVRATALDLTLKKTK